MKWLDRAKSELSKAPKDGTAKTAKTQNVAGTDTGMGGHEISNTPKRPTAKTAENGVLGVLAVPHFREVEKTGPGKFTARITRDPHFGADRAPERYARAWDDLLSQCPAGVTPVIWQMAIYDTAALFGMWGAELARLGWMPGDLFDVPRDGKAGLAWHLRGGHVAFLGRERAFLETGRIFDRTLMGVCRARHR